MELQIPITLLFTIISACASIGVTYGLLSGKTNQLTADIKRLEEDKSRQVRINEKVSSIEAKIDFIIAELRVHK